MAIAIATPIAVAPSSIHRRVDIVGAHTISTPHRLDFLDGLFENCAVRKLLIVTIALSLYGCGDNSPSCGEGTVLNEDGFCVPTATCGPGTVANENGECVPDGSVVCSDGTMFDTATGTCVPSDEVCGDGTVLIDGVCRDPATVTPDATESAEVNDQTGAGQITVPGIGEDGFVIHGCIDPRDSGATADIDPWLLQASGPMVLEISADGLGGLAAGFVALNIDDRDDLAAYVRIGLNTSTDSSKRQLYLPAAGNYVLLMADQRTILGLGPAGNPSACYYTTIKQVALPAPTPLTLPTTMSTDDGNVKVFRFTSTGDGTILKTTITESSNQMDAAWVAVRANTFHGLGTDQGGFAPGPTRYIGAINNGQTVDVIVDMEFNASIAPVPFQIDSYSIGAAALPAAGGTATVTKTNGTPNDPIVDFPMRDLNFYYFDVAADDDLVHFDIDTTDAVFAVVFRTDVVDNTAGSLDAIGITPGQSPALTYNEYVRFLNPGRYYVAFFDPSGVAGEMYTATSTMTKETVAAMVAGTLDDQPIAATGSAFRTFDPGTTKWLELSGGGANLGTGASLEVLYYPSFIEGQLDLVVPSDQFFDQTFAADGSDPAVGRVAFNFPFRPFLVRFRSSAAPGASQTFDYTIATRTFTDLMTVTEAAPVNMTGVSVPAGSTVRFFVQTATPVTIATTGADFDVAIYHLDYDEFRLDNADVNIIGDETLADVSPAFGYVAFELENFGLTTGTTDLGVTTFTPAPFVEICPSHGGNGTAIALSNPDQGQTATQTLPFSFSLFGTNVTMFKVSANGFLSFDPALPASAFDGNGFIPSTTSPNAIVAPYWDDLDLVEVCVRNDANRTIVEWTGELFFVGTPVQFQASIYNTNSRVEFAYGPQHAANGSSATGGIENAGGTDGIQAFRNTSGAVQAGGGRVLFAQ